MELVEKTTKTKTLKNKLKGKQWEEGGKTDSGPGFFFFNKITLGAWSTVEKRWEGFEFFFFFPIVIVLFAAEGLEPISQQLFEIILKTIKQTSSLLSASLTAVLFKWGFQYKRPVVPHLRDIYCAEDWDDLGCYVVPIQEQKENGLPGQKFMLCDCRTFLCNLLMKKIHKKMLLVDFKFFGKYMHLRKKIILPICLWKIIFYVLSIEKILLIYLYLFLRCTFICEIIFIKLNSDIVCLVRIMYYKQHLTVQYFEATYISPSMSKDGKWLFTSQHQRLNLTILKSHWAQTQGTTLSAISLFQPGVK